MNDSCIIISEDEEVADESIQVVGEFKPDLIDLTDGNETITNEVEPVPNEPAFDELLLATLPSPDGKQRHSDQSASRSCGEQSKSDRSLIRQSDESEESLFGTDSSLSDLDKDPPQVASSQQSNKRAKRPRADRAEREQQKLERERIRQERQRVKELERIQREVNRANAGNKSNQNCIAIVDKEIFQLLDDPNEAHFKTLFDESSLTYRATSYPKYDHCVTWEFKRAEFEEGSCVMKTTDTDCVVRIMDGAEYVKAISHFKTAPNHPESLYSYIKELHRKSRAMIVMIVYKLNVFLRKEQKKQDKNYQKKFRERYEAGPGSANGSDVEISNTLSETDLDDLRSDFELEIEQGDPDWEVQMEFYEKTLDAVSAIVRHTKATAAKEISKRKKATLPFNWSIASDKVRAVDPTESNEASTKLWMQQLQQFSQITLPTAKAIAAEYPTAGSLIDQYNNLTRDEALDLLAPIRVQRNMNKQVGQILSRKIYKFLTGDDPDFHISFD